MQQGHQQQHNQKKKEGNRKEFKIDAKLTKKNRKNTQNSKYNCPFLNKKKIITRNFTKQAQQKR